MSRLDVFEPAMCCPTGVCGIDVDPVLVQFNADLKALEASGVTVSRHSLSHDAAAFAAQPLVLREIEAGGFQVLHQRISLTPVRKLWIAMKTNWRGR